jgi:phosphoribosylformylglycinamidine synthase
MTDAAAVTPRWPDPWAQPPGTIAGASDVRVLVLSGYGLNCEAETAAGFRMVGAATRIEHFADVLHREQSSLEGVHILVFVGGFSFGDHIASGRVFANRIRYRFGDRLTKFVDDGGLVLGICNGFQTLVKLGLLPGVGRQPGQRIPAQQVSLVSNDRLGYRNAWVRLRIDPRSPCVFTRGSTGAVLELPSRHGEGKLVVDPAVAGPLADGHMVPMLYADLDGQPTERWPDNPNGSSGGAAGLCDASGRIFGIMPHPEAYLYPENHPHWIAQRDAGALPRHGHGLGILAGGVRAVLST